MSVQILCANRKANMCMYVLMRDKIEATTSVCELLCGGELNASECVSAGTRSSEHEAYGYFEFHGLSENLGVGSRSRNLPYDVNLT